MSGSRIDDATVFDLASHHHAESLIRAVQAALEQREIRTSRRTPIFFEVAQPYPRVAAKLIGARPEEFALTAEPRGRGGRGLCADVEAGDEVVTEKASFPWQYATWKPMEEREGVK